MQTSTDIIYFIQIEKSKREKMLKELLNSHTGRLLVSASSRYTEKLHKRNTTPKAGNSLCVVV